MEKQVRGGSHSNSERMGRYGIMQQKHWILQEAYRSETTTSERRDGRWPSYPEG